METRDKTQVEALTELINEVRSTFHLLKALARVVHGGPELTAARRGVLLDLRTHGDLTVPTLARMRPVSRQHIQEVVNGLVAEGWVELIPNPAHKRSRLVSLTPMGSQVVSDMMAREKTVLEQVDLTFTPADLAQAASVLRNVKGALEPLLGSATEV